MSADVAAVLAAARALLFVREQPTGSNAGQGVEAMLKVTGLGKGHPWCAAYVAHAGVAALGRRWPVPRTAACRQLGEWAERRGVLRPAEDAEDGDVFLLWYPTLNRFAHTGFVLNAFPARKVATIEGNTSGAGVREGWGVFERTRTLGPRDRVIRWTEALS